MKVSFTGTREGMTDKQLATCKMLLEVEIDQAHHGMCVGADSDFHRIMAWRRTLADLIIFGYPSTNRKLTAQLDVDFAYPRKPPLDRNRDIVDAGDWLLAAPDGPERVRSGTWSTVRYARRIGRPTTIVYPDGHWEANFKPQFESAT